MKEINVFVAQLTPKLGDKQYNYERIAETVVKAREERAQIVIFPELFLSGYSVGKNLSEMSETIDGPYMTKVRNLCKQQGIYVVLGFPEDGQDGNYYISSALIDDQGKVLGVYRKMHLFDAEKNYFQPGSTFEVIETPLGSIGLMICFDVEFPEIARALKLLGADLIVIINANMHPYEMHHHIFARSRAMENEIPVIICNRLGKEGELDFCGDSMVIDAAGKILLALKDKEQAQAVTLPVEQELDSKMSYTTNRRSNLYGILSK
ncbi:carbon-nitrogen hydrolase family protein [Siminovitchia sp. 179-K 8D1 HS]|uniref:carbon-nitrogen hydrolase family protein n=1 Tax=Siminovitchia sp. 179-K 8D1 HS TaxID=3142385 RepID=UPI0039A3909D